MYCVAAAQPVMAFPPSDPMFADQWHLHNTGQGGGGGIMVNRDLYVQGAWNVTTGDPSVVVAILDDGTELTHPDLAGNVFTNYAEYGGGKHTNSVDEDANGYTNDWRGWDFADNDNNPFPETSEDNHGTAAAGLICAVTDNGEGVAGVAPRCRFLPIRVAVAGVSGADWAKAIRYAASFTNVGVISISASLPAEPAVYDALRYAVTEGRGGLGCVVCTALGNAGVERRFTSDAAAAAEALTVSGTTDYDRRSWFADYGAPVNLVCPAGGGRLPLVTTDRIGTNGYDNGSYTTRFGATSASCALASGVAALLIHRHPTWPGLEIRRALEMACDKIDATAHPYDSRGWNPAYGYGRVNAWSALTAPRQSWDTYEPDDTLDSAVRISDGEMQYRAISPSNDCDWARVSVSNQSDIQVTVVGATNMSLRIYDGNTNPVSAEITEHTLYCDALTNGTYYIAVQNSNGIPVSHYGLHYARLNFRDDYESDDTNTSAGTISPRAMQSRTLYPTGDVDWATFELSTNRTVEIWTMGEWNGWLQLSLWNSNATQQLAFDDAWNVTNGSRAYITQALNPGTYNVMVKETDGYEVSSYQLLLDVHEPDDFEDDDSHGAATPIASGQRKTHTLHSTNDLDWHVFTLTNQANVLILTDTVNPRLDPDDGDTQLSLFLDDGVTLVKSDNDGNNRFFSAVYETGLDPGTYRFRVRSVSSNAFECANYYVALDVYRAQTSIEEADFGTNGLELVWQGDASYSYEMRYTNNLFSTQAWAVATNVEGRVGRNSWFDTNTTGVVQRYYRILVR